MAKAGEIWRLSLPEENFKTLKEKFLKVKQKLSERVTCGVVAVYLYAAGVVGHDKVQIFAVNEKFRVIYGD